MRSSAWSDIVCCRCSMLQEHSPVLACTTADSMLDRSALRWRTFSSPYAESSAQHLFAEPNALPVPQLRLKGPWPAIVLSRARSKPGF